MYIAVGAFGATRYLLSPDQAEEAVVKDNLLQRTLRMFVGNEEKSKAAVDAALEHGMMLERHLGTFLRALCRDPPARVQPTRAHRKPGAFLERERGN